MPAILFRIGDLTFRLWDLIDILIIAVLIYRSMLLIKGTLAVQMLLGLTVLFGLLKGSEVYELNSLHRLLLQFWQSWVILVVVLFQPEIRRALAQVGQQWALFRKKSFKHDPVIHEIVNAASSLASARIGALIVIERETGLANYREMGMTVDAKVSSELLRTIFYPHSPLHDGAVIIHQKRIASVACFLPLTRNPLLALSLGTRHRAAIGVTEESDAAAIIVSEERGTISLAINGSIEKMNDTEQLKRRLSKLMDIPYFLEHTGETL